MTRGTRSKIGNVTKCSFAFFSFSRLLYTVKPAFFSWTIFITYPHKKLNFVQQMMIVSSQ